MGGECEGFVGVEADQGGQGATGRTGRTGLWVRDETGTRKTQKKYRQRQVQLAAVAGTGRIRDKQELTGTGCIGLQQAGRQAGKDYRTVPYCSTVLERRRRKMEIGMGIWAFGSRSV
jgi:hypothetical protein